MEKSFKKNEIYIGSNGRKSLYDFSLPKEFNGNVLIFIHGYMGFKDWGAWNLMEDFFVSKGFGFLKFNLSHNGGTITNPIDFDDLEAFSENTYTKELQDIQTIIDLTVTLFPKNASIHLIGHSRGGGMALLAGLNPSISSIICLAAICSIAKRFSDENMLSNWKKDGVRFVTNQRTKQEMPHKYLQVEDYFSNKHLLSIESACELLKKPILLIHGNKDVSVSIEEGAELATRLIVSMNIIQGADHVFGTTQPWNHHTLPVHLEEACNLIQNFLISHFANVIQS